MWSVEETILSQYAASPIICGLVRKMDAHINPAADLDMFYDRVFEFWLEPYERSLMRREDIPPKPAGVGYTWLEIPPKETFGYRSQELQPFNQGTFSGGCYVPAH